MEDVAVPAAQMGGGGRAVPAAAAQGLGEAGEAEQQQEIPKEGGREDEGEAEGGGAMPIEAAQGGNESPGVAAHRSGEGEAEERQEIHRDLLCAAISGDSESMKAMVQHSRDPSILLGTTPSGNTCLHISSIHGHQGFCQDVITPEESLLSKYNLEQETPLVVAVTLGHTSLASLLLGRCHELGLRQAILEQDRDGFNALHHAIRNGHQGLALELIKVEPALSQGVSKCNQSPRVLDG